MIAARPDPTASGLGGIEACGCWECTGNNSTSDNGMRGRRLICSRSGCHGREGCCEAMRITVVMWEYLIPSRVLGTMQRHKSALIRPRIWRGRLPPRPCRLLWRTCP